MSIENCPELQHLVQRLAKAMNEKGRFEHEDSEVSEGRLHADEEVNLAIAAIRAHKVDHQCEIERPVDESIPAAS